ncbi:hypothetical protein NC651_021778 [Populus alba x Populus x berolinensis]|nr:hypothetical protein NC651_021778 [Populus alba x Populus x berolinensis]
MTNGKRRWGMLIDYVGFCMFMALDTNTVQDSVVQVVVADGGYGREKEEEENLQGERIGGWTMAGRLDQLERLKLACSQVSQDRLRVRFIQFGNETRRQMPWEGGHPTSLAGEEDE